MRLCKLILLAFCLHSPVRDPSSVLPVLYVFSMAMYQHFYNEEKNNQIVVMNKLLPFQATPFADLFFDVFVS